MVQCRHVINNSCCHSLYYYPKPVRTKWVHSHICHNPTHISPPPQSTTVREPDSTAWNVALSGPRIDTPLYQWLASLMWVCPGFITWSLSSSSPICLFPHWYFYFFFPLLLLSTCSYPICIIKFHDLQTTETYPSHCKQNGNWYDKEEEAGTFLRAVRMSRSQHRTI